MVGWTTTSGGSAPWNTKYKISPSPPIEWRGAKSNQMGQRFLCPTQAHYPSLGLCAGPCRDHGLPTPQRRILGMAHLFASGHRALFPSEGPSGMARSSDRKSLQREDGTAPYQSPFPGTVGLIPCVIPCAIFRFFDWCCVTYNCAKSQNKKP